MGILKKSIGAMKYGTVALNAWSIYGSLAMIKGGIWCACAQDESGHSGYGYVGNMFNIPNMAKTVIYGQPLSQNRVLRPPQIVYDALFQLTFSKTKIKALINV